MAHTHAEIVQNVMGAQLMEITRLQAVLEAAEEQIAALTPKPAPPTESQKTSRRT